MHNFYVFHAVCLPSEYNFCIFIFLSLSFILNFNSARKAKFIYISLKLYCVVFSFTFFYYYFTVSTSRATNSSHLSCSTYLSAIKCIRCISHSIGITRCMKGLFPISNCVMNPFHDSLATHEKKYLYYDNRNSSLSISTQFSRFCFFFSYSVSFARMMK